MDSTGVVDKIKAQELIDLFIHPVMVIDNDLTLVSSNHAFKQESLLADNTANLLKKVEPLISGAQELVYFQVGNTEKLLTAMPMAHGKNLIKIAEANQSPLAKRYNNIVSVIDQMSDAVIISNKDGNIDLVNEQFQKIFYSIDYNSIHKHTLLSLLNEVIEFIYPDEPKRAAILFRYLRLKIFKNKECSFEFSLPNGKYFHYRDNITYSGERIGIFIDESTFKALTDQLEVACQEANDLSEAKSNFMAAVSHEVRTPLNAIIGLLDLSQLDPQLASNEFITRMGKSARYLLRLINDVLDFSKFDANKAELSNTETNLRILCEDLVEKFSANAKSNNTALMLFVDPNLPKEVMVDEIRLNQILSNLVSNGLKFNNNRHPELKLEVRQDDLTGYIIFSVSDNGIGIDKEEQILIFDTFSQANSKIHGKYGGTGLGLSICQQICNLMGGGIFVESEIAKGAKFTVQLPLESVSAAEITQIDTSPNQDTSIVTNDPYFYQVALLYSESLKFSVYYSENLPKELKSTEILCINPLYLDNCIGLKKFSDRQMLYLDQAPPEDAQSNKYIVNLTPLHLDDLLLIAKRELPTNSVTAYHKENNLFTPQNKIRALLVEDNPDNMYIFKKQFENINVAINFATSAEEALVFFEQQSFDLVISDYQMPLVSGAKLISILREIEEAEQCTPSKMYILTADKTERCNRECIQAGANKVLIKPISSVQLTQLIKNIDESLLASAKSENARIDIDDEHQFSEPQQKYDVLLGLNDTDVFIDPLIDSISTAPVKCFDIEKFYDVVGHIKKQDEIDYLQQFAANLAQIKHDMANRVVNENWPDLQKSAHSLKSSAMIVGAEILSHQCESLEACGTPNKTYLYPIWLQIEESIQLLINTLNKHCSQYNEEN
ncbi:ATP-binding protein [Paraglaciecola aquimarina]|uniref:histidine kinase n=1 Tax=Paraglaciecola algarum TaxID=3050085 RepID=A0ABS9DBM0_9ALTE|nr:ATP-binding protein [Paraglaciecola sp. G1-23]MCF2950230.1 ATP-binding protein [Paraglaciecola sp. G1-23]